MFYLSKIFSWFWHIIYFIVAHLPARILTSGLVYLAIISLLLHFASYYIEQHPHKIEKFAEQYLLVDIRFSSAKVYYNILKPSIKLYDLSILKSIDKKSRQLNFNSASISINMLKSIVFWQPYIEYINLDGLKTSISRNKDGNVSLASLNLTNAQDNNNNSEPPLWLLRIKSFSLSNSQLLLSDEITGINNYFLDNVHINMTNLDQWTHQLSIDIDNQRNNKQNLPLQFDKISFNSLFKGSIYNLNEWDGKFALELNNLQYKSNQLISDIIEELSHINLLDGSISGKLWGVFSQFRVSEIIADIKAKNLKLLNHSNQQQLHITQLNSLLKLNENRHFIHSSQINKASTNNWQLSLYQLNFNSQSHNDKHSSVSLPYSHFNILKKPDQLTIKSYIEKLTLSDLDDLFLFANLEKAKIYQAINPTGSLQDLNAQFTIESGQLNQYKLFSKIKQLGINGWQQIPQFENVSGKLWLNNQNGFLTLDSNNATLFIKPLFRKPWQFDKIKSTISWQQIDSQWWINADTTEVKNDHLTLYGNSQFWLSDNHSPLMLINAYFKHIDVSHVPLYLPVGVFNKPLLDWLDNAFVAGHVPDGGMLFRGRLSKFPYPEQDGLMDISFHTQDLQLNYTPDWPLLNNIASEIQFTESGFVVDIENASLYNSYTKKAHVELKDYEADETKIRSTIYTTAEDTFKYLLATKLLDKNNINQLKSNGKLKIDLRLSIPQDDSPITSVVTADFKNLTYTPEWLAPETVNNVSGKLIINNDFILSNNLSGFYLHNPLKVKISSINKADNNKLAGKKSLNQQNNYKTRLFINGTVTADSLKNVHFIPKQLGSLFTHIKGKTNYQAELDLNHRNGEMFPDLLITSDLQGINSKLPEPFKKSGESKKAFSLKYTDKDKTEELQVSYADILAYCSLNPKNSSGKNRTHINLMTNKCSVPPEAMILITGKLNLKNYNEWQKLMPGDNDTKLDQSIKFDLNELILPGSILQSSTAEKQHKTQTDTALSPVFAINGDIDELIIGESSLGNLSIRSRQEDDKLVFDKIKLAGKLLNLDAQGHSIINRQSSPETLINGKIDIKDTGKLLKQLEYYDGIERAQGKLVGDLKWPGSITEFSLKALTGNLNINFSRGTLTEVNPGIARIIAIINLNDIFKRLELQSDNLTAKGFTFDSIRGNLLFDQGKLNTQDINIDSSIAKINIDGHVILADKSCHHKFTVTPDISTGLPYAGLAIAGPAGAAIGLIGQNVLGSQINKISEYKFDVNGLCENPQITNKQFSANKPKN